MESGRRVLIVEDDSSVGQVLADVLTDEGYEVRWAMNGRLALTVLDSWQPHIIVLDLMMPVMDGRAFRRAQLRLAEAIAQVPVMVLSGMREADVVASELGAIAMITKPFDLGDLLATIERLLA